MFLILKCFIKKSSLNFRGCSSKHLSVILTSNSFLLISFPVSQAIIKITITVKIQRITSLANMGIFMTAHALKSMTILGTLAPL